MGRQLAGFDFASFLCIEVTNALDQSDGIKPVS